MNRTKALIVTALVTILISLVYLVMMLRWKFCVATDISAQETMFVEGYGFLPMPVVGVLAGILLQVFSFHAGEKNGDGKNDGSKGDEQNDQTKTGQ